MSTTHRLLGLVLSLADIACGVRVLALSVRCARSGQQFRDVRGASPTLLLMVMINIGLVAVLSTS